MHYYRNTEGVHLVLDLSSYLYFPIFLVNDEIIKYIQSEVPSCMLIADELMLTEDRLEEVNDRNKE